MLTLSSDSVSHCKRHLIAAVLYVIAGGPQMMGAFPYEYRWLPTLFARESPLNPTIKTSYSADALLFFNQCFEAFLNSCFGFSLNELAYSLPYVVQYFGVPMTFELPAAAQAHNQEQIIQNNYEEFLAFQTHNKHAAGFISHLADQPRYM